MMITPHLRLFGNNGVIIIASRSPTVCLCPGLSGLAELASRKYKPAAKCFLQASFDHCDCPEVCIADPFTVFTIEVSAAVTLNASIFFFLCRVDQVLSES